MSDEAAVMVEPTACAVHGALSAGIVDGDTVVVLGAGTLGLLTIAAVRRYTPRRHQSLAVAKYPVQRELARELGRRPWSSSPASCAGPCAAPPARSPWATATSSGSPGRADVVIDCVGSDDQPRRRRWPWCAPAVGSPWSACPAHVHVDLTGLWQREIALAGALRLRHRGGGLRHLG